MSFKPSVSMRELLEAGVHYGHKTSRWNPRMAPYIYGERNGIHIIDLQQTLPLTHRALQKVFEVVRNNGRILFVGTKRQVSEELAETAQRCGQYYVNHRWLGGMLTNWKTVSRSIRKLKELNRFLEREEFEGYTKKEVLNFRRQQEKLNRSLGGITEMGGCPDLIFVIDSNRETLAMQEARKLGIPIIAVLDSNSDPSDVDYPIPGNDDATRSIQLYCRLMQEATLAGIEQSLRASGVDMGESQEAPAFEATENASEQATESSDASAETEESDAEVSEAKVAGKK